MCSRSQGLRGKALVCLSAEPDKAVTQLTRAGAEGGPDRADLISIFTSRLVSPDEHVGPSHTSAEASPVPRGTGKRQLTTRPVSQSFCPPPHLAEPSTHNFRAGDHGAGGGGGAQEDSEERGLSSHHCQPELGVGHDEEGGRPLGSNPDSHSR